MADPTTCSVHGIDQEYGISIWVSGTPDVEHRYCKACFMAMLDANCQKLTEN